MKKRLLSIFCVLALCLGLLPVTALAIDQAPSGSGTEESPYQIGTADELRWLAEYVNGNEYDPETTFLYVELTADIDLNPSYTFAADGTFTGGESPVEWAPIGLITTDLNTQKPFYGSFDGKGHTIRGLYTAAGDSDSLGWGLFSYAVGYITDLHLENSYIGSVSACTGSIAGILGGTIENCSSAAYLSCGENWGEPSGHGGIVGNLNDVGSEALSCTFSGVLHQTGGSPYVGGVVGSNLYGYVADCVNRGSVTADNADKVGGIVGDNSIAYNSQRPISGETSVIERCVNYGAVTSTYPNTTDNVGGIVGMSSWGDGTYAGAVRDCLNLGTVTGVTYVGGIAGYLEEDTPLENCYNAGSVTNGTNAAGLVGKQSKRCPITNSYYLQTDTLNSGLPAVGALGTEQFAPTDSEKINYTAHVTTEAAASGQLAWTLQKGRETLVWGQALTGQTPDETPGLTAEQEKRVMQVKFLSAEDPSASELAVRYTNAGAVLADYPSPSGSDQRYIFYTDSDCAQAIAPDTHTFAADATLYVKTTTPTQVTITGVTAQGGTYNGQTQAGYTGTPSAEGYDGDFTVTYNTTDGKAPTNAGNYAVTIAIPDSDPRYVGRIVLEFTIAKKALTVSAPSPSVYVGDSAPELALTYTGLVDGDSVTPSQEPDFTITKSDNTVIDLEDAVKTVGTYTITWSNANQDFSGADNYAITLTTTGTLTVSNRSSGGTTTYPVQVEENSQNGGVQVSPKNAVPGTLVTVTPQPAPGYELATLSVLDQYGNEVDVNPLGNGNYSFKMPRSGVKVEATFYCTGSELCPTHHLADVLVKAWYHDAVDYVVEHGIMTGTSATTFEPNTTLSRAMVAQILYNLEGQPTVTGESTFTDVSGHWAIDAITWAQKTGVVTGYENNTFQPNQAVTREELAQVLYNYAQYKKITLPALGDLSKFPDGDKVSPWARTAMKWATGLGVINGYEDSTLEPGGDSTRAQAASILMNFDVNLVEE